LYEVGAGLVTVTSVDAGSKVAWLLILDLGTNLYVVAVLGNGSIAFGVSAHSPPLPPCPSGDVVIDGENASA